MKKVLALIMVIMLSLTMIACGPNDTPDSPNRTVDPGQQTDIDPDDDPAEDPDDPADDPADDPGDDDPEPIVDEPDDPSGPKGKLEPWESYTAFSEKKGKLVSLVMDGMTAKPELGMEIMHLLGVAVVDLFMLPAALIGQEEAALNSALSFMGGTNVKSSRQGDDYLVEWTDSEGSVFKFTSSYDPAKEALTSEVSTSGESGGIFYDYIKTSYGYFAQIYSLDEGGNFTDLTQISIDDTGGVIGIQTENIERKSLSGSESRDLPKSMTQWYEVDGTTFSCLSSEGTSYTHEFEPNAE